jgi:hypothetical protein
MGTLLNARLPTQPDILLTVLKFFVQARRVQLHDWEHRFLTVEEQDGGLRAICVILLIVDAAPLNDVYRYEVGIVEVQRVNSFESLVRLEDNFDTLERYTELSTSMDSLRTILQELANHIVTISSGSSLPGVQATAQSDDTGRLKHPDLRDDIATIEEMWRQGYKDAEIARKIGKTAATVKYHRRQNGWVRRRSLTP